MAKIIQFQAPQHSNLYFNMVRLIPGAESVAAVNFFVESIEACRETIPDAEYRELIQLGRKRRFELAAPQRQEPQEVTGPGVYAYTPEMGQTKPECQIEARSGYYDKHVCLDTPLELKGRGIEFLEVLRPERLTKSGQYKAGWFHYRATNRAFDKLKEKYTISRESLLD